METSLLSLEHVGQRLKRSAAGARYGAASAAVVDQSVYRFLQHSLLVADDDVGSAQLQQSLKTVVSVDDPSVQVVEVGGGESAAVQLHHRTDVGRDDGNDFQDHPLGTVAGGTQRLDDFQSSDDADSLLALCVLQLGAQVCGQLVQVDGFQQLAARTLRPCPP